MSEKTLISLTLPSPSLPYLPLTLAPLFYHSSGLKNWSTQLLIHCITTTYLFACISKMASQSQQNTAQSKNTQSDAKTTFNLGLMTQVSLLRLKPMPSSHRSAKIKPGGVIHVGNAPLKQQRMGACAFVAMVSSGFLPIKSGFVEENGERKMPIAASVGHALPPPVVL